jgi:hypothetical protein
MLTKAAPKSQKEVGKLRKTFEAVSSSHISIQLIMPYFVY